MAITEDDIAKLIKVRAADFFFTKTDCDAIKNKCDGGHWQDPVSKTMFYGVNDLPNYLDDIDACHKYMVPQVINMGYDFDIYSHRTKDGKGIFWSCEISKDDIVKHHCYASTTASAAITYTVIDLVQSLGFKILEAKVE